MKYYLCIDLGATNLRVGIVDENKKIIKHLKEKSTQADCEKLYSQIKRMIEELEYQNYNVVSLGISACGLEENGVILYAPNLRVENFNLKKRLENDFTFPIKIANDANASALSEAHYGVGKEYENILFTTISSGLGVGLIYKNKLINMPFEAGHQLINYKSKDYDVEYLLSGNGLVNLCALNNFSINSAKDFFIEVKNDNKIALNILDDYTSLLAKFYYNMQVVFNVDCVILSGGMMKSKEFFFPLFKAKIDAMLTNTVFKNINFVDATFDQDAGFFGACAVAEFY